MSAMSSTTAKLSKPMRLNQRAALIPTDRYAEWHQHASATAGLTKIELAVLSAVAEYYRLLDERGYTSFPSIETMALSSGTRSSDVTTAIKSLVSLCLLAVRPGSGRWRNEYLMCLPRRLVAALSVAADDELTAVLTR
jgi:hypothetical protein